ncbi:MAG: hypothetical protein GZ089_00105 [Aromatoleum sp.]|nr:hypothetical protein [Aromatoleum sp.]
MKSTSPRSAFDCAMIDGHLGTPLALPCPWVPDDWSLWAGGIGMPNPGLLFYRHGGP